MDYHPQLIQVAIPESRAKMYAQQLFSAVEHLHIHGISHNDIKPSNILLSSDDRPILIDFGFAQQWDTRSPDRFLSSLSWGTPEYLSPERANGHLHDERLSDIWALGITLYEIVVGRTPFEESEEEDFLTKGQLELYHHRSLTGKFYGDYLISSELENLVRLMVDPNPHTRAQSCGKALRHRFFNPISPSRSNQKTASMPSTPQSTTSSVTKSPIATSSAKRTPRQTPKKKEAITGRVIDHRSLTGKFYGDYLISSELENLVRLMVDPNPHTRAQSCGKALRHRFFNPISPSRSNQSEFQPEIKRRRSFAHLFARTVLLQ